MKPRPGVHRVELAVFHTAPVQCTGAAIQRSGTEEGRNARSEWLARGVRHRCGRGTGLSRRLARRADARDGRPGDAHHAHGEPDEEGCEDEAGPEVLVPLGLDGLLGVLLQPLEAAIDDGLLVSAMLGLQVDRHLNDCCDQHEPHEAVERGSPRTSGLRGLVGGVSGHHEALRSVSRMLRVWGELYKYTTI